MYSLDNRHALALPYWARPGLVSFAAKNDGGGKDDEGDDDEGDDGDKGDDDEGDDTDPDEGKTPEELAAELKTVRLELKRTRDGGLRQTKRRKAAEERATELESQLSAKGKGGKEGEDDDADVEERIAAAVADATKSAQTAANDRIINSEARAALVAKGADPKRVPKLLKLLDREELEVGDDDIDGLDDAVDDLVSEWPELFGAGRKRRKRIAGDADDGEPKRKVLSATERQAAQLRGGK